VLYRMSKFSNFTTHLNLCILVSGMIAVTVFPQQASAQTEPLQNSQQDRRSNSDSSTQRNYFGIGGTIGLTGKSSALGTGGFSITSKNMLTNLLSIDTNTIIFGSAIPASTTALTLNFPIRDRLQNIVITPFFGAGVLVRSNETLYIDPLVIGGIDVPLSESLIGNLKVEVGFPNTGKADVGISVGIGHKY
jgi:hypothetical protein